MKNKTKNKKPREGRDIILDKANENTLKFLTVHPRFSPEVEKIRCSFGLENKTSADKLLDWLKNKEKESIEFCEQADFKKERMEIGRSWGAGEISFQELERKEKNLASKIPIKQWENAIGELCALFGLHDLFRGALTFYVFYDEMPTAPSNYSVGQDYRNPRRVDISIFGHIADREMKEIVRRAVKGCSKHSRFFKVFKSIRNIDKDIEIYKKAMKIGIAETVREIYPAEGKNISKKTDEIRYARIKKKIKRIKRYLRNRFPEDTFTSQ